MRPNTLRTTIAAGHPAVNGWVSGNSGYAAEVLSHAGFDSVTIDAQHGMFGRDTVVTLLQAISTGPAIPLVRPSSTNAAEIGWLLDAGAYGIIAPSIDTPELAGELVAACRYPPAGRRSFGAARGLLYGGKDYVDAASDVVTVWAMIESVSAVKHLEQIIATPGLYGVYLGPNDLALDLGLPPGRGVVDQVADIAHRILEVAAAHGVATGLFCADGEEARHWADQGFNLVTPGNDMSLLRTAAADRIATIRGTSTGVQPGQGGY